MAAAGASWMGEACVTMPNGSRRCTARRLKKESVKPAEDPVARYLTEQCGEKCADPDSRLCKKCVAKLTKSELTGNAPKANWQGYFGEEPPAEAHIIGSAWNIARRAKVAAKAAAAAAGGAAADAKKAAKGAKKAAAAGGGAAAANAAVAAAKTSEKAAEAAADVAAKVEKKARVVKTEVDKIADLEKKLAALKAKAEGGAEKAASSEKKARGRTKKAASPPKPTHAGVKRNVGTTKKFRNLSAYLAKTASRRSVTPGRRSAYEAMQASLASMAANLEGRTTARAATLPPEVNKASSSSSSSSSKASSPAKVLNAPAGEGFGNLGE